MNDRLIGSFYFKRTHNGNLIGEFSNNMHEFVVTESCDLDHQINHIEFVGTYKTSWRENDPTGMILTIERHPNSDAKFKLIWRKGNTPHYSGEGFLVDGMLIGFYTRNDESATS